MENLTAKDAIALLDKIVATVKLDRNEHSYVILALQTLQKLESDYEVALEKIESLSKQSVPEKIKVK